MLDNCQLCCSSIVTHLVVDKTIPRHTRHCTVVSCVGMPWCYLAIMLCCPHNHITLHHRCINYRYYRQVPLVGAGCFRQVAALHSDHYRQVPLVGAGCCRQVAALHSDHYRQVPLIGAGCFRQVAALHSDHYRQVPLIGAGCFRQVAAFTVTTVERSPRQQDSQPSSLQGSHYETPTVKRNHSVQREVWRLHSLSAFSEKPSLIRTCVNITEA